MPERMLEHLAQVACNAAGYDWHEESDGCAYPTAHNWRMAVVSVIKVLQEPNVQMIEEGARSLADLEATHDHHSIAMLVYATMVSTKILGASSHI